ncbi:MAG TPA: M56 family metallopeptidase [Gemmatimonadaceae bacterium]
MILSWMLSAILFTACVAVGAASVDSIARALGWPARWTWSAALAVGALWPVLAPLAALVLPQLNTVSAILPTMLVAPDAVALLRRSSPEIMEKAGRALLGLWALATLLLAGRLLHAVVALRRLRAGAEPRFVDGVPVLVTDEIGPATIGWRRRTVIIPRTLLELEEPLRLLVLRHEREHCAARDPWLLLGTGVAVVFFPWNAALWFIARRLHLALEMDCDARVLASGADPTRYGQLLLWIAQRRSAIPFATMLAAPPSHLERRIIAMRITRPRFTQLVGAGVLLVVAIAGACSEGAPNGPLAQKVPQADPHRMAVPSKADGPYVEFQVENQARQIPGTGKLTYPAAMRQAQREGEVLAQFVIDPNGVPDASTFRVLKSSDPAFTAAVHEALSSMRFVPARVGGRAVRQVVQEPFTFALQSTP